jgi:hypothetical protein
LNAVTTGKTGNARKAAVGDVRVSSGGKKRKRLRKALD